jgi:tRNA-dihydrouridine synthase B
LLEHYHLIVERFGPQRSTILMRRYACTYAQGRHGARAFRAAVSVAKTPEQFFQAVDRTFLPSTS